ncbi:MAG: GNAT family N-acetyltransferase [Phycisphaerae bacterium]
MATAARRRVSQKLEFWPLTAQRWSDLETLFGERGACGGCWCMWWRLTRAEFEKRKGAQNKRAMKRIVNCGEVPGLLAYADGEPIGWCAVGPREWYPVLQRSRVLKPVDDQPVWAVTCFFIAKPYRGKGISVKLLKAAVALAKKNGARIVEGYPVEPKKGRMPDAFAWTGLAAAFRKAGFVEVLRRSETRPIMRYVVKGTRRARR